MRGVVLELPKASKMLTKQLLVNLSYKVVFAIVSPSSALCRSLGDSPICVVPELPYATDEQCCLDADINLARYVPGAKSKVTMVGVRLGQQRSEA